MSKELELLAGGKGLPVFINPLDGEVDITGANLIVPAAGTVFVKLEAIDSSASGGKEDVLAGMKLDGSREVELQVPIPCYGEAYFKMVEISAGQIAVYYPIK